ncbi:hypothetical protein NFJ02_16g23240 [Pycnococcus provasolii]
MLGDANGNGGPGGGDIIAPAPAHDMGDGIINDVAGLTNNVNGNINVSGELQGNSAQQQQQNTMQNLAHTGGNSSSSRQPTRVENLLQGYPQLDVPPPPHADADNALYKLLVQNRHVMQRTADVFKKKARAKKTRMNTPEDDAAFAKLVRMECTDEGKEDIALAGEEFPTELLRKSKSSTHGDDTARREAATAAGPAGDDWDMPRGRRRRKRHALDDDSDDDGIDDDDDGDDDDEDEGKDQQRHAGGGYDDDDDDDDEGVGLDDDDEDDYVVDQTYLNQVYDDDDDGADDLGGLDDDEGAVY